MSYKPRRPGWREYRILRGLRHRLTWWGERTDNPVLLLHGWGDCSDTWQFLVDCLPPEWSLVGLDWRGFGGTEWPQQGYFFPDYLADLEALLDTLSPVAPVRIIAHSMGGTVASMYAGIRPQRIAWLVNLEGLGLPVTSPDQAPVRYAEWLDQLRSPARERRYTTLDALVSFLLARNPRMRRERAEYLAQAWCVPVTDAGGGFQLAFDPRHNNVNPVLFRRAELESCWRRVQAPVLLVLAEESEIRRRLAPEHATPEYFRSMFRDVRIEHLARVGHMLHIEDPESLAALCVEFAQEATARRLLPAVSVQVE